MDDLYYELVSLRKENEKLQEKVDFLMSLQCSKIDSDSCQCEKCWKNAAFKQELKNKGLYNIPSYLREGLKSKIDKNWKLFIQEKRQKL